MSGSLKHIWVRALVAIGVLTALLALSPAAPASAAEIETQTVSINLTNTRTGLTSGGLFTFLEASPTFNQFNPTSGTLVSATLSWSIAGSVNGSGDFAGTGVFSYAGASQARTFDTVSNPGPKTFDFTGSVASPGTVQGTGTFAPSTFRGTISHSGFFPWSGEMSASGTVTLVYEYTTSPLDTTPPAWSNVPTAVTAEATGPSGAAVTYTAPTASDAVGVTSQSCAPPPGTTFPLGTTTVTCTASDAAGNTGAASFTVTVSDTTDPVVVVPTSPLTVEATSAAGAAVSYTATASDTVSGARPTTCTPASGGTFPIGSTTVSCSATDEAGNSSQGSFTVIVGDTTAPVLSLPSNPTVVEATAPTGAIVNFSVTATDTVTANPTIVCAPPSGSVFPLGSTTVSCTARDAAGNQAQGTFAVIIRDTTAPVLTLPPTPIVVNASGPAGATVSFTVTATDTVTADPTVMCTPPSGSLFAIGQFPVSCTATDAAGNQSQGTFAVTVLAPSEQIANEIVKVRGFGLQQAANDALVKTLEAARAAFVQGNVTQACGHMTAFLREVTYLRGRRMLTSAEASELIADANRIRAVMACG